MTSIAKTELIGKRVTVKQATNKSLVGMVGTVVDETKSTFLLLTDNGEKKLLKNGVVLTDGEHEYVGTTLMGKHHDRVKR